MYLHNMHVSTASTKDIPALVALINSAYRGEASKKGWTTEADLLKGELRTDTPALTTLITTRDAVILKHVSEKGDITGCVYLHKQERGLYLGMLTVSPGLQGGGIGKQLLAAADNYAREHNCSSIFMNVISVRHELVAWYERHGFRKTDERKPFPESHQFGIPTQPLEFVIMEKRLDV
jgi:N-acetylglutamate synthase-like GNAT family acetyltransferase